MSDWCIVIGASAGGVETLEEVVAQLPADLPAPVFIVLHVPPYYASNLPAILTSAGPLKAVHPSDGDSIRSGLIYIAPPDHHVLINKNKIAVKRGPKENRFRPSIDALFRSAAYTYGERAIGVVLSGALDDGTSGLWTIDRLGGISIVETPERSRFDSMPRNALEYVNATYQVSANEVGDVIGRLVNNPPVNKPEEHELTARIEQEVNIAAGDGSVRKNILEMGEPTPFTCPECHGVLVSIEEGKITRYRCHTGHAYTDNALLEELTESVSGLVWQVIRGLQEATMLLTAMAQKMAKAGDDHRAQLLFAKANFFSQRAKMFQSDVLKHETLSVDNLEITEDWATGDEEFYAYQATQGHVNDSQASVKNDIPEQDI